jgi:hypothetical protein
MRLLGWLLVGVALMAAIAIGLVLIGFARLSPGLARRLASSALAAGLLGILVEVGFHTLQSGGERIRQAGAGRP